MLAMDGLTELRTAVMCVHSSFMESCIGQLIAFVVHCYKLLIVTNTVLTFKTKMLKSGGLM